MKKFIGLTLAALFTLPVFANDVLDEMCDGWHVMPTLVATSDDPTSYAKWYVHMCPDKVKWTEKDNFACFVDRFNVYCFPENPYKEEFEKKNIKFWAMCKFYIFEGIGKNKSRTMGCFEQ